MICLGSVMVNLLRLNIKNIRWNSNTGKNYNIKIGKKTLQIYFKALVDIFGSMVILVLTTGDGGGWIIDGERILGQYMDPEANIWAQEAWEWAVEKAPQWGTS